jgi:hypothetical protein
VYTPRKIKKKGLQTNGDGRNQLSILKHSSLLRKPRTDRCARRDTNSAAFRKESLEIQNG